MSVNVDYGQWNSAARPDRTDRRSARSKRQPNRVVETLEGRVVLSSWLDSYADFFNTTFGSGYSRTVGGWICDAATVAGVAPTLADASDAGLATATVLVAVPTGFFIVSGGDFVLGVAVSGGRVATTAQGITTVAEAAATGAGVAGQAASLATDVAELAAVSGGAPAGGAAAAGPPLRMISELCTEATGTNNMMQWAKLSGRWKMGEYTDMGDQLAYYIKRLAEYGIHNFDHLAN